MKSFIVSILAFLSFGTVLTAQEFPSDLKNSLQSILDAQTNNVVKGAALTVIMPDEASWTGFSGIANNGDPINLERTWSMGSQVKSLISAAIFKLHDEDLLSIEDSIHEYLAPIENVNGDITIKQLLRHTGGLGEYWESLNPSWGAIFSDRSRIWTIPEMLEFIPEPFQDAETTHHYSNTNVLLLGLIMEEVTGKSCPEVLEELIFTPLGLTSSFLPVAAFDMSELNGVWNFNNGSPFYVGDLSHDSYLTSRYSWIGKIEESALFARARAKGQLYSQAMHDSSLVEAKNSLSSVTVNGKTYVTSYGMGYNTIDYAGEFMIGHGGSGLSQSLSFHFIERDVTVALINNVFGSENQNEYIFSLVLAEIIDYIENNADPIGGTNHLVSNPTINIYPNPASSEIVIQFVNNRPSILSAGLYDLQGRKIAQVIEEEFHGEGNVTRSTGLANDIAAGIYFLNVRIGDSIHSRKMVIE